VWYCLDNAHLVAYLILLDVVGIIVAAFKATPHKDCASDAPSDFLSDCAKIVQAGCRLSKDFCAR
jgi:hypothetical protein